MASISLKQAIVVLCTSFLSVTYATAASQKTSSSKPTTTVYPQPGCPSQISVRNGGFESGKIAPWTVSSYGDEPPPTVSVITPGYDHSKYAVQFTIPGKGFYSIQQQTTGNVCFGYYYNISYAWNWVNYAGPADFCSFQVQTGYTSDNVPTHYASRKTGWQHNSYIARDLYSHCKPLPSNFNMFINCGSSDSNATVPAFSIRFDAFSIQNAPGSPNPPPPPVGC